LRHCSLAGQDQHGLILEPISPCFPVDRLNDLYCARIDAAGCGVKHQVLGAKAGPENAKGSLGCLLIAQK
jgi:hypothetical protein